YQELGVQTTTAQEDIRRAFRQLAKIHHPDKPSGDPYEFRKIREAYDVLKDDSKRAKYDKEYRDAQRS
ncbi:heat shock protein DnaJ, partial [Microthyrium microscopicum]